MNRKWRAQGLNTKQSPVQATLQSRNRTAAPRGPLCTPSHFFPPPPLHVHGVKGKQSLTLVRVTLARVLRTGFSQEHTIATGKWVQLEPDFHLY